MAQKSRSLSKQEVEEYKRMIALIDRMRKRDGAIDPLWLVGRKQLAERLGSTRRKSQSQSSR